MVRGTSAPLDDLKAAETFPNPSRLSLRLPFEPTRRFRFDHSPPVGRANRRVQEQFRRPGAGTEWRKGQR